MMTDGVPKDDATKLAKAIREAKAARRRKATKRVKLRSFDVGAPHRGGMREG